MPTQVFPTVVVRPTVNRIAVNASAPSVRVTVRKVSGGPVTVTPATVPVVVRPSVNGITVTALPSSVRVTTPPQGPPGPAGPDGGKPLITRLISEDLTVESGKTCVQNGPTIALDVSVTIEATGRLYIL